GGPVRLVVPEMYGYKSVKWLERIRILPSAPPGYWEERGYATDAWIGGAPAAGAPAKAAPAPAPGAILWEK
ncbi:MAG: molybdopterin-dependent oxidoreductase, partial [Firmicutes bacterium]|nr:molybdopterin-dependent oxidoreductase [Bacillota bacterium]